MSEKKERRNVVFVGPTGQGKSTLANFLTSEFRVGGSVAPWSAIKDIPEHFPRGRDQSKATTKICAHKIFEHRDCIFTFIDTPGLDDDKGHLHDVKHVLAVAEYLQAIKELHGVVFVVKRGTTLGAPQRKTFRYYGDLLRRCVHANPIIVVTDMPRTKEFLETIEENGKGIERIEQNLRVAIAEIIGCSRDVPIFAIDALPSNSDLAIQFRIRSLILDQLLTQPVVSVEMLEIIKPPAMAEAHGILSKQALARAEGFYFAAEKERDAMNSVLDSIARISQRLKEERQRLEIDMQYIDSHETDELETINSTRWETPWKLGSPWLKHEFKITAPHAVRDVKIDCDTTNLKELEYLRSYSDDRKTLRATVEAQSLWRGLYCTCTVFGMKREIFAAEIARRWKRVEEGRKLQTKLEADLDKESARVDQRQRQIATFDAQISKAKQLAAHYRSSMASVDEIREWIRAAERQQLLAKL